MLIKLPTYGIWRGEAASRLRAVSIVFTDGNVPPAFKCISFNSRPSVYPRDCPSGPDSLVSSEAAESAKDASSDSAEPDE
ncbi:hypothetical protein KM043_006518 [Ampulex compressa]|nr:hypothetical protein KM043_006518 [Ampulex compressa]